MADKKQPKNKVKEQKKEVLTKNDFFKFLDKVIRKVKPPAKEKKGTSA